MKEISRAENSNLVASLWKTTEARLRRERKNYLPTEVLRLFALRTSVQPGTDGTNRIQKRIRKIAYRVCR